MRKKKVKKVVKRFKYLKEARKNVLFNFRNNLKIKGCYLTMRYIYPYPSGFGNKREECLAIPFRYKQKLIVGDVVLFTQIMRFDYAAPFRSMDCRRKEKVYFKILDVTEQEIWDGITGPYIVVFLGIEKLNNLEFLSAMNEMKKRDTK
jgi:hypothetical protein